MVNVRKGLCLVAAAAASVASAATLKEYINDGESHSVAEDPYVVSGDDNGTGYVQVESGSVNVANGMFVTTNQSSTGYLRISDGGSVTVGGGMSVSRKGDAIVTIKGGSLAVTNTFAVARVGGSYGILAMSGGTVDLTAPGKKFIANASSDAEVSTGVVSVASSAFLNLGTNRFILAQYNRVFGALNLYEGGTVEANNFARTGGSSSGYARISSDGGTLRVNGRRDGSTPFVPYLDEFHVGRRGITIDTGVNDARIDNIACDGTSPGKIVKTGSGGLILTRLPQTHGGIDVREGRVACRASPFELGPAYAPAANGDSGNAYPENASEDLIDRNYLLHRWSFTGGSLEDSIGGKDATAIGENGVSGTMVWDNVADLPGTKTNKGVGKYYLDFGKNLFGDSDDSAFTIEFWAKYNGDNNTSFNGVKFLAVGNSAVSESSGNLLFVSAKCEVSAKAAKSGAIVGDTKTLPSLLSSNGKYYHFSVVFSKPDEGGLRSVTFRIKDPDTGADFSSGVVESTAFTPVLSGNTFTMGHSPYQNNYNAKITVDEVRIWKAGLSDAQLTANAKMGPDELPLLAFNPGAGPVRLAEGTLLNLGAHDFSYGSLAGSGSITTARSP